VHPPGQRCNLVVPAGLPRCCCCCCQRVPLVHQGECQGPPPVPAGMASAHLPAAGGLSRRPAVQAVTRQPSAAYQCCCVTCTKAAGDTQILVKDLLWCVRRLHDGVQTPVSAAGALLAPQGPHPVGALHEAPGRYPRITGAPFCRAHYPAPGAPLPAEGLASATTSGTGSASSTLVSLSPSTCTLGNSSLTSSINVSRFIGGQGIMLPTAQLLQDR
jgi:hypothetical protein